ncbi:MAG: response regulator [Myxococcales bacterium]|nr:response regulator [Myxococcales bacterium]
MQVYRVADGEYLGEEPGCSIARDRGDGVTVDADDGPRIFIVEDDAGVAEALVDALGRLGFALCGIAENGEAALRLLPRARPDLVLIDLDLSSGLSGVEIAERLGDDLNAALIFLTSNSHAELAERALRAESAALLHKPFHLQVLKASIEMALFKHRAERQLSAANRALADKADELERSLALVQATLDATADGLLVVDRAGHLSANRQLLALWGIDPGAELRDDELRARLEAPLVDPAALTRDADEGASHLLFADDGRILERRCRRQRVGDLEVGCVFSFRDVTREFETHEALRILSTGLAHLSGEALLRELCHQLARLLDCDAAFVSTLPQGHAEGRLITLWVDGEERRPDAFAVAELPLEAILRDAVVVVDEGARARFPASRALAQLGAESCVFELLRDRAGRHIGLIGAVCRRPLAHPDRVAPILSLFAVLAKTNLLRAREAVTAEAVFEFSPDGLLIVRADGEIVAANSCAENLLGYARGELVGTSIDALVPDSHRDGHARRRAHFHGGTVARYLGSIDEPLKACRRDGDTIPVDIGLGPFSSADGAFVVVSLRDLRAHVRAAEERASLELQLRQLQKMEALGTLAGGIAHDFNNILGAIVANIELLRADLRETPAMERLEEVSAAADRATLLVRQILAFSRQQSPQRRVIVLAGVVREATTLLRATLPARIHLHLQIDDDPAILADATQIHQVLMNLGTNALHAIGDAHGEIVIRLQTTPIGRRTPRCAHDRYAELSVRDDGCGMDAATLDRIFDPFFTTKPTGEGSGLGLSVVHGIVIDHGGELAVDSAPGRGTTFTVLLPLAAEEPETAPVERHEPLPGDDSRVILIDDDPVLATVGEALLTRLGYQVRTFTDPCVALEALRAAPESCDLVLTDCNMPKLSGLDIARALRELRPELPLVLVSGHTGRSDEEIARAGIRYRLDKPYNLVSLNQTLAAARGVPERDPGEAT